MVACSVAALIAPTATRAQSGGGNPLGAVLEELGSAIERDRRDRNDGVEGLAVRVTPDWAEVARAQSDGRIASPDALRTLARRYGGYDEVGPAGAAPQTLDNWISQTRPVEAPVLIPPSLAAVPGATIVSGQTYYAASATTPDQTHVGVIGMCSGVQLPDDDPRVRQARLQQSTAPTLPRLQARYVMSEDEEGMKLQFSAFKCAYEITVACASAGCDEQAAALGLADSLGVLNPR